MMPTGTRGGVTLNRSQKLYVSWLMDVLVYIVVLNLYVEFSEAKVIDSFLISVLTAILLKLLLVVVIDAKYRVWGWAKSKGSRSYTVVGVLGVWTILFLSKFLILETVDFVFGDHVELGGFIDVMLLVAVMMISREAIQRIYYWLGRDDSSQRHS